MSFHHPFFGTFASEAEMVEHLRAAYPRRSRWLRVLAQIRATIFPTRATIRFIEAYQCVGRFDRRRRA